MAMRRKWVGAESEGLVELSNSGFNWAGFRPRLGGVGAADSKLAVIMKSHNEMGQ